ncbi:MAG: Ni/Fe-hydrogenase, b-type cytochrome subunit [Chlorobi bacterium]|nr:Ni/Fe-hydrogenase, b-type cytochrome subunit [Chlorobiota bacterium]
MSTSISMRRVYVWQLPVRLYHWINALCILVLAATGYLIGNPFALQNSAEAYLGYWFGTVRFIHFAFAFLFFFNFVYRIYFGFVGNRFAKWGNFIPHKKEQFAEMLQVLKIDILQTAQAPLKAIGHNSLAGVTYFITFLIFLFQSITGFGMYAAMSNSWFPSLFAWIVPLMGGDAYVRVWHHLMMWFFIIFAMIHVYLVFYHDYVEGRGTISSMGGGWKFIEKERLEKDVTH